MTTTRTTVARSLLLVLLGLAASAVSAPALSTLKPAEELDSGDEVPSESDIAKNMLATWGRLSWQDGSALRAGALVLASGAPCHRQSHKEPCWQQTWAEQVVAALRADANSHGYHRPYTSGAVIAALLHVGTDDALALVSDMAAGRTRFGTGVRAYPSHPALSVVAFGGLTNPRLARDPLLLRTLYSLAESEYASVRAFMASELPELSISDKEQLLKRLLRDSVFSVRRIANDSLRRIGSDASLEHVPGAFELSGRRPTAVFERTERVLFQTAVATPIALSQGRLVRLTTGSLDILGSAGDVLSSTTHDLLIERVSGLVAAGGGELPCVLANSIDPATTVTTLHGWSAEGQPWTRSMSTFATVALARDYGEKGIEGFCVTEGSKVLGLGSMGETRWAMDGGLDPFRVVATHADLPGQYFLVNLDLSLRDRRNLRFTNDRSISTPSSDVRGPVGGSRVRGRHSALLAGGR